MSFIDKFKSSAAAASQAASAAAGKASSTAKTAAAIARLKLNIASEEDKLKKAYIELGRLFLRDMDAQVEADMVEYNPWCEKAHDAVDAIARMTAEMDALKAQLHNPAEANIVDADASVSEDAETPAAEEVTEPADEPLEEPAPEAPETAAEVPEEPEEDTSIFADAE